MEVVFARTFLAIAKDLDSELASAPSKLLDYFELNFDSLSMNLVKDLRVI